MDNQDQGIKVIEINLKSKYVLIIPHYVPREEFEKMKVTIKNWMEDVNQPFLLLTGEDIQLVKVEDEKDENETN